jgi:hypothetical protein
VAVKSLLTDITHAVVSYQRIKSVGLLVPKTVFFSQKKFARFLGQSVWLCVEFARFNRNNNGNRKV